MKHYKRKIFENKYKRIISLFIIFTLISICIFTYSQIINKGAEWETSGEYTPPQTYYESDNADENSVYDPLSGNFQDYNGISDENDKDGKTSADELYCERCKECENKVEIIKKKIQNEEGEYIDVEELHEIQTEDYYHLEEYTAGMEKYPFYNKGRGITKAPKPISPMFVTDNKGLIPNALRLKYKYRGTTERTCIIVHLSRTNSLKKTIGLMERNGFAVQIAIDKNGKKYQLMDSLSHKGYAARGIDGRAIHVMIIGKTESEIMQNYNQKIAVISVLNYLVKIYKIHLSNCDVQKGEGIFGHYQTKMRYGGITIYDPMDPGENYMEMLMEELGGYYYKERKWKDRFNKQWKFFGLGIVKWGSSSYVPNPSTKRRKNNYKKKKSNPFKNKAPKRRHTKGPGLSIAPVPDLPIFAKDSNGRIAKKGRLKYPFMGYIDIKGIVLHFTATDTLEFTKDVLQWRGLCSHILVDSDGSVYQAIDSLEEKAAAASGTNDHCIQVEIIARNEDALLSNTKQMKNVIEFCRQACRKYKIPVNNYDIESNEGIFSHGQAKKRWAQSAWLYGWDFDPGERYMKEVITSLGGTYYPDTDLYAKDKIYNDCFQELVTGDPIANIMYDVFKNMDLKEKPHEWKNRFSSAWEFYPTSWAP